MAWPLIVIPCIIIIFYQFVPRQIVPDVNCKDNECCSDKWITRDIEAIRTSLSENVFGQHLVHGTIYKALKDHIKYQPQKPLVLSFHGSTGTGKNYVSKLIVEKWFKKGMNSKYVRSLTASKDFERSNLDNYKKALKHAIVSQTKTCKHSIFIFDEIDNFPHGLLDSIRSYLEYNPNVDGVDYRNTIFIFLSNAAGGVTKKLAAEYYDLGLKREDIKLKEAEQKLESGISSSMGDRMPHLIKYNLISHHVPFLPLEKQHVKECIRVNLRGKKKKVDDILINKVISELQFTGTDGREIFSVKGCKNVDEKVNLVIISSETYNRKSEL